MTNNQNNDQWKAAEAREERKARLDSLKTNSGQKKKITKRPVWQTTLIVVLVVAVIAGLIALIGLNNGWREKYVTAAVVNGQHKITPLEFNYLLGSAFNQTYRTAAFAPQTRQMLNQVFPGPDGYTSMRDSLIKQAEQQLQDTYGLYDLAKAAGTVLTDEDKAVYDTFAQQINLGAAQQQTTPSNLLKMFFGPGAGLRDIKTILERHLLANRYQMNMVDEYEFSDDEIQAEYEKNPENFDYVSFHILTINNATIEALEAKAETAETTVKETEAATADATEETTQAADNEVKETEANATPDATESEEDQAKRQLELNEKAKNLADDIAGSVKSLKDFTKAAIKYSDDDMAKTIQDDPNSTLVKKGRYQQLAPQMRDWLYAAERQEGDTTVIANQGQYAVVYFVRRGLDETNTYTSRHILIKDEDDSEEAQQTSKEKAEAILDEFKAGEQTEEAFAALAKEKSDDPGSKTKGGLYEKVTPGQFVPAYEEWCMEDGRKTGDVGMVRVDGTGYSGYHIIYFIGYDEPLWKQEVEITLANAKVTAAMEEMRKNFSIEEAGGMDLVLPVSKADQAAIQQQIDEKNAQIVADESQETTPEATTDAD